MKKVIKSIKTKNSNSGLSSLVGRDLFTLGARVGLPPNNASGVFLNSKKQKHGKGA
jgi:hypothetical protein